MVWKTFAILCFSFIFSGIASAQENWACWYEAAQKYNLPPDLLYAIAHVESGNRANAIGRNTNGSYDIGVMQINSMHLPMLREKYGIREDDLIKNPCLNVHIGAMILRQSIDKYGWNWRGLGAYNAASDHKRAAYAGRVLQKYRSLFKGYNVSQR